MFYYKVKQFIALRQYECVKSEYTLMIDITHTESYTARQIFCYNILKISLKNILKRQSSILVVLISKAGGESLDQT